MPGTVEQLRDARMARRDHEVELAPIREAFRRSGLAASQVARELGWRRHGNDGWDGARVLRQLGIRPEACRGRRYLRQRCSYDRALALVRAIGADPVDAGL